MTKDDLDRIIAEGREARESLLGLLRGNPTGLEWCRLHSDLADGIVRRIFALAGLGDEAPVAAVAVGGYGRRELAPGSDVDITFIPNDELGPDVEEVVRSLFRAMLTVFDGLGWPVGYAYRLSNDAPALDPKTTAGLLDARHVAGSVEAMESFIRSFREALPVADFIIAREAERREMRQRWNDTPLVAEPHLREGAGGLRDLQTARWITSVLKLSPPEADAEAEVLLRVRNVLHLVTARKEDRLLRTRMEEVANVLKIGADDLSASVMEASESLQATWFMCLGRAKLASFPLAAEVTAGNGACLVGDDATLTDAAIGICKAQKLSLNIQVAPPVGVLGDSPRIIECVTAGENALRALDAGGILNRLLPEFEACRYLLSRDSFHTFSVVEHTLRVIAALDRLRDDPRMTPAWDEVTNHRPLYLAALLHDLGKADPSRDHSSVGAEIAQAVCERWGVAPLEAETVHWLVLHHLDFAEVARTHDLARPETALMMSNLVGKPDRLSMLYLLTVADGSSVGEGIWTQQLALSTAELFERTRAALGTEPSPSDPAVYRGEAMRRLKGHHDVTEELLSTMPTHYLLATPGDLFPLHADCVARAREGETVVVFQNQPESATTDVTVCALDLPVPGLLSRILGVVYALDLTLHSARVASTAGANPIALDVLSVSYRSQVLPAGLSRILAAELKRCLYDESELEALLRQHGKDPDQEQAMLKHRFFEGKPGVLEIETPLGRGMAYRVTKKLARLGWDVHFARISQWAGKAVARFYLDEESGLNSEQVEAALTRSA